MKPNRAPSEYLVLSVQPRFAEAIVDGRKTIEVRRRRPNVKPGTLGFVYSSSPVQAVIGSFRVDRILSGTPEELWLVARNGGHISREDFDSYFADVAFGHALVVSCGQRLPMPIKLSYLRAIWPGCSPPRSFGYFVPVDAYSRRMVSILRDGLPEDTLLEEPSKDHIDRKDVKRHRGAFLLTRDEVRALVSMLGAEDQQIG